TRLLSDLPEPIPGRCARRDPWRCVLQRDPAADSGWPHDESAIDKTAIGRGQAIRIGEWIVGWKPSPRTILTPVVPMPENPEGGRLARAFTLIIGAVFVVLLLQPIRAQQRPAEPAAATATPAKVLDTYC